MANFSTAADVVFGHEGGYQKLPQDRGNYNSKGELVGTNWGIAAFTYEDYYGYPPTEANMRNLTKAQAHEIYKARFWDRIKGDQIESQEVALIFFDGAINHGVGRGTKLMQKALNDLGAVLIVDGAVGPLTLGAINKRDFRLVHNQYKKRRTAFYQEIVANRPDQAVFLNGWLNRINSFPTFDIGKDVLFSSFQPSRWAAIAVGALVLGLAAWLYFNRIV